MGVTKDKKSQKYQEQSENHDTTFFSLCFETVGKGHKEHPAKK